DVARVRNVQGALAERRRHVVDDLGALDQQRLLLRLFGPAARPNVIAAATDAELLERLERSIERQTPRDVEGLIVQEAAREPRHLDVDDPVAIAIALGEGVPSAALLEHAERCLERHPEARALGLLIARTHRLQHQLGRALGILDRLGGPEAEVEAAEIARRADDDSEAERRLAALELSCASQGVRARAAA